MYKKAKQFVAAVLAVLLITGLLPEWSGGKAYAASGYTITSIAGTGVAGFSGDGGQATLAQLGGLPPWLTLPSDGKEDLSGGMAVDSNGNMYIADIVNNRIRKIDTSGKITTVAGTGVAGFSGDGQAATLAQLSGPRGVAVDSSGNLYIADGENSRIRKVDTSGKISTVAGGGTSVGLMDGKAATLGQLRGPRGVAVDSDGNLYIAEYYNNVIRKVDTSGTISTVAGTMGKNGVGTQGFLGDGFAATLAQLYHPSEVGLDNNGNLYILDSGNRRIRKVDVNGLISIVAGGGLGTAAKLDGATATGVPLPDSKGMAIDSNGNMYVTDYYTERVFKIDQVTRVISVLAGIDGGVLTSTQLSFPTAVTVDSKGNLYMADGSYSRIRKLTAPAVDPGDGGGGTVPESKCCISTVAGNGNGGYSGDGGLGSKAQLNWPFGVAVDSKGNLYIADSDNQRIRKVDTSGMISTMAGTGKRGPTLANDGLATKTLLDTPYGVSVDNNDNVYIADKGNNRILKVDTSGIISVVAGIGGIGGYSGDGGLATAAKLNNPTGVAIDSSGNLFIADRDNQRIRKVDASGKISTFAGTGDKGNSGDGGLATAAQLSGPRGVAVDSSGNLYILSYGFVRKVDTSGKISTVAGSGSTNFTGDGGLATLAGIDQLSMGLAVDSSGNLYIADRDKGRIRKVDTSGKINTVVGGGYSGDGVGATLTSLNFPNAVALDSSGNLYIAESGHSVRKVRPAKPAQTVRASALMNKPGVGTDNTLYLVVMDEGGTKDTTFSGAHDVTISGYAAAPDGSYGSVNGNVLTASPTTISLTFANGLATANLKLNQAAAQTISSSVADVATPAANAVSITPAAGKAASLILSTDLAAPASSGGAFAQQPVVTLYDAYGNVSTGDSSTVVTVSKKDTGTWTLTGTATKTASAGVVAFTGLGAANAAEVTGAQLAFDAAGLPQLTSTTLTLPAPEPAQTVSAAVTTVTPGVGMDDAITLTVKNSQGTTNTTFSGAYDVTVSGYAAAPDGSYGSVNGEALTASPNTISVTFASGVATVKLKLYQAAEQTISLSVTGVTTPAANPLSITPVAGKAASLALSTDLAAPASNGGVFKQQPVVTLRDAYGNTSTGDSSTVVTISKKDTGPWTLTGTATSTASAGVVAFAGLGAANAAEVTGAQLAFDAAGLPQLASTTVTLPAPMANAVAPHVNSAAGGDSHVLLNWNEAYGSVSYAVYQRTASDPYGAAVATVSGSVYSYDVKGLTNGTTYYFVVKATNSVGDSATSDEISGMPRTVPSVPMDVTAVAGEGQATVSFTIPAGDGGSAITGYEVTASPGNLTATGTTSPITITGLSNGLTYTFTVKAINNVGSSAASAASNTVTPKAPNDSTPAQPGTPSTPVQPGTPSAPDTSLTGVEFLVNGKAEKAGLATTTQVNEQTVTTVVLDPKVLEDKLAAVGQDAVITISVKTKSDIVIGEMNGQMLKDMEPKHAVIVIKTENATYTLPAQQVDISALSEQFGKNIQFKDIKVQIEISKPTADTMKIVENAAAKGRFTPVTPPLNFTVRGTYGDTTIEVSKFNAYVERTMVLPEGTDLSKITTGVVIDPDGTVRPVPTQIVTIDGKYVAKVNSLTNSTYSIVEYPIEFKDISQHWAKNAVNDMGFRRVVNGTGKGMFNPDQAITRAEFATIMVRGLGLKPENGASPFADVKNTDWYSGAIQTAYAYKLISGFEDGTFRPNDQITREQAMVVIAKAMRITTLKSKLPVEPTDAILRPYTDAADASRWALSSMADSIQAGVVSGRTSTKFAPKAYLTRAEVTTIIQRLLQKSGLID